MSRAVRAIGAATVVLGLSVSAPSFGASTVRCAPGANLRGHLTELGTNCHVARRIASGYFTESPPGEHVGSLIIHGFYCEGRYRRSAFHISCGRRHARVWFVGSA